MARTKKAQVPVEETNLEITTEKKEIKNTSPLPKDQELGPTEQSKSPKGWLIKTIITLLIIGIVISGYFLFFT
ncbi:MAG: hypothetical protein KKB31_06790 [Nanoarchaeota archaeon]|nr:hypothetical protein [Nanoarchaeota archaeon]